MQLQVTEKWLILAVQSLAKHYSEIWKGNAIEVNANQMKVQLGGLNKNSDFKYLEWMWP